MSNQLPTYDDLKYVYASALYEEWYPGMTRDDKEEALRAEQFDTVINNMIAEKAIALHVEKAKATLSQKNSDLSKLSSLLLDAWAEALSSNPALAEQLWKEIDKL